MIVVHVILLHEKLLQFDCATGAIYIFSYNRYFAGICYLWSYPSFEYFRVLPMIVEIAACVKLCGK